MCNIDFFSFLILLKFYFKNSSSYFFLIFISNLSGCVNAPDAIKSHCRVTYIGAARFATLNTVTMFSMWKSPSNVTDLTMPTHVARQCDFVAPNALA